MNGSITVYSRRCAEIQTEHWQNPHSVAGYLFQ